MGDLLLDLRRNGLSDLPGLHWTYPVSDNQPLRAMGSRPYGLAFSNVHGQVCGRALADAQTPGLRDLKHTV